MIAAWLRRWRGGKTASLRLAFQGPGHQGGAIGDAAAAMIDTLRRTGLPLDIYPAPPPDPSAPIDASPAASLGHSGAADIAIVTLGGAAETAMPAASLRIGWWLAPADTPPANSDVLAIDELWVATAEIADALRGQLDVPVSVTPIEGAALLDAVEAARKRPRPTHVRQPVAIRSAFPKGLAVAAEELDSGVTLVPLEPDGSLGAEARNAFVTAAGTGGDRLFAFAPVGALRSPLFARHIAHHAAARADAALFYADDLAIEVAEPIDQLRLKPEFDRTLLAGQDYVGAPIIARAAALARLGAPDPARRTAAMADLLFRADTAGLPIARIPEILLAHPRTRVRARAEDYLAMLRAQPRFADFDIAPGLEPESFALSRRFEPVSMPQVTILIPTMRGARPGRPACIERLLDALAGTDWPMDKLMVIVGDDVAGEPLWATRPRPFALRRIETVRSSGERFNYAAKMNRLWREAATEQIVFMNDDILPLDGGWLRALQTFALEERVGGVGARLLFEDGTLQHAGIVPQDAGAAHAWVYRSRVAGTYQGWARVHREWSMVTGALFATRRSVMERMDGFDERFSLEFNDTDLCLRMRAMGYRIVCTPHAELVHLEKVSRGDAPPPGDELALFQQRWSGRIDQDPSWHPALRRDWLQVTPKPDPDAWYL